MHCISRVIIYRIIAHVLHAMHRAEQCVSSRTAAVGRRSCVGAHLSARATHACVVSDNIGLHTRVIHNGLYFARGRISRYTCLANRQPVSPPVAIVSSAWRRGTVPLPLSSMPSSLRMRTLQLQLRRVCASRQPLTSRLRASSTATCPCLRPAFVCSCFSYIFHI